MIRFVRPQDVPRLLEIYAQYIDTPTTFEYPLPSLEEFSCRIAGIAAEYPYLVLEEEGRVMGYAYAHRLHERAAYQWNAELSVYLDREAGGHGAGKRLYRALEALLRLQGVRKLCGIVVVPNPASEALHLSLGFSRAALFEAEGYKQGGWRDVCRFEKRIGEAALDPAPILKITELDAERVCEILEGA